MSNLNNFFGVKIPLNEQETKKFYPYLTTPELHHWTPTWANNMASNYATIKKLNKKKHVCLSSLKRPQNKPVIIIGSGPSLNESSKFLKDWKGAVISGATSASVFPKNNIEPDFIAAFDSHWSIVDYLNSFEWKKSSIITHPMSDPKLFEFWKNDVYLFRRIMKGIPLYDLDLPLLYPEIALGIVMTSSVVNNMLSIANFLGFGPIFLFGGDLSYTEYGRCSYYKKNDKNELEEDVLLTEDFIGHKKTNLFYYRDRGNNTNIITSNDFCGFKEQLYQLWGSTKTNFYNCSKGGILTEMPFVEPEEVIENQGEGFDHLYNNFNKNEVINNYIRNFRSKAVKGKKVFE